MGLSGKLAAVVVILAREVLALAAVPLSSLANAADSRTVSARGRTAGVLRVITCIGEKRTASWPRRHRRVRFTHGSGGWAWPWQKA